MSTDNSRSSEELHLGFTARLVKVFLTSKLPTIFIVLSLFAGAVALIATPREEDPQIKVPMIDVLIRMPGATPEAVSYTHLTLPTTCNLCRARWSPYH